MNRKLIFLDIDGTLTEPGKNVPPASAVEAVRRARERGHRVLLCSGRNYGMLYPVLQFGFDGLAASAGGYIPKHLHRLFQTFRPAAHKSHPINRLAVIFRHPSLRGIADMICPPVGEDGIFWAFERLGVI